MSRLDLSRRRPGYAALGALLALASAPTAHARPLAETPRAPIQLTVEGCPELEADAILEVLRVEAPVRLVARGEPARDVIRVRCHEDRVRVELGRAGAPPHSTRELRASLMPPGSQARVLVLVIAEMFEAHQLACDRATRHARAHLRWAHTRGAHASHAAQLAAPTARARALRARSVSAARRSAPPARHHTLGVLVSGDMILSAPAPHLGLGVRHALGLGRRLQLITHAGASRGRLEATPGPISSTRLRTRALLGRELRAGPWALLGGVGAGAGLHRLEGLGARAQGPQTAWRLGPASSLGAMRPLGAHLEVGAELLVGYSLLTYGAWAGEQELLRAAPLWTELGLTLAMRL